MTVLVIGGNSGLGQCIAHMLVEERGMDVLTPDADQLDVRNERDIAKYIGLRGPFDHIVYSAGINQLRWIKDVNMRDLELHFTVNTFGPVLLAAEHLRTHPDHPVNFLAIVSDSFRTPMRGSVCYGSSKTGLTGVLRNMARELADEGWRVNGVSPGIIDDTPMTDYIDATVPKLRGWTPEEAKAYENSMVPIHRRVTKLEVAHTVSDVLFGPEAMTGSIVEITGGK